MLITGAWILLCDKNATLVTLFKDDHCVDSEEQDELAVTDAIEKFKRLNKALEFVREREKVEREIILTEHPGLDCIHDWPAVLSEWKLDKGVRQITAYQAKRFARHIKMREV